jgi:hypothetical protein
MLAALGCLPLTAVVLFVPEPAACAIAWIFVAGIAIHCFLRRRRGRSLAMAAYTGAWLLPVLLLSTAVVMDSAASLRPDFLCPVIGSSLLGLLAGFVVAKQIEAAILMAHVLGRRLRGEVRPRTRLQSIRERLDEESTPLAVPPGFGLPRRFGIRGMLIATTWAAVLMGGLRACGARPERYFLVLTFTAGVMAAQVLLFRGRRPFRAAMFAGAFLLPAEMLAVALTDPSSWLTMQRPFYFLVVEGAFSCAFYVCAGILFGAVAGAVGGWLYYMSEEFLLLLTRGVPAVALEPITDADADTLIAWISGPKLCERWAGRRLTWPLDREQILGRFAIARGDQPIRRIFKAVDAQSGNMLGYLELGGIDYHARNAWLEMPLVDPDASERGRIGLLLLRAVVQQAFEKLGFLSLKVSLESEQSEIALCCGKYWMSDYSYRRRRNNTGSGCIAVFRRWVPPS